VGELVDEAFADEGILGMRVAAPIADRHGARTHGVLDAQVRDRIGLVGERRGGVDILQRGRGDAALQRHRIARVVEPRLQPDEARRTVRSCCRPPLAGPDEVDRNTVSAF
jgi:hypothetical protein